MKNKTVTTPIVIGLVVVVFLVGGYIYMTGTGGTASPLSISGTASSTGQQFESLAAKLTPITLNGQIFTDPRFKALSPISTPVAPEPIGRPDPFAPAQ